MLKQLLQNPRKDALPPMMAHSVLRPAPQRLPLVLASPHSGMIFPQSLLKQLKFSPLEIRRQLEDSFVDQLFAFAPELGVPLIKAEVTRVYADLNREPYELDPAMYREEIPFGITRSRRAKAGFGTIIRTLNDGRALYRDKLGIEEITQRIEGTHIPYHRELARLTEETRTRFGFCLLIDCHSMPSDHSSGPLPAFVLGDQLGKSCAPAFKNLVEDYLVHAGFKVGINKPYAGGYTTQHYGRPAENIHALQLEIRRDLYMDEKNLVQTENFMHLQAVLKDMARYLALKLDPPSAPTLLAAAS